MPRVGEQSRRDGRDRAAPAAMMPTNMNCEAPAKTSTESSIGAQIGKPEPTAMAP